MPRTHSMLRALRNHLATHPAYTHYAVYSALLYATVKVLGNWPWTWVGLDTYFDNLSLFLFLEAFWPTAFYLAMILAIVALFRRPWWKRGLAAVVLAAQFNDWAYVSYLPESILEYAYDLPIFADLLALVTLGPIIFAVEATDGDPAAIAFSTALHAAFLYAVLRFFLWTRLERALGAAAEIIEQRARKGRRQQA